MFIVYSILAVLLIGQLICTVYLVTRYSSSPEKQWKNKVLSSLDSIQTAQKHEQLNHDTMSRSQRIEVERLESQAINRLLQQMPVSMLADYPGIGPSTVEKLQYAGFSTVFDVHTRGINIHGIGDKRLSDINVAQNQLCQQVLAKIKNANSIEYQQLAHATEEVKEAYAEKNLITEARLRAIKKVHELMQEAVIAARKISFWGYVKGINRSFLPDSLRNFGFPNLTATLEKAEAKARSKRNEEEKLAVPQHANEKPPKPVPVTTPKPAVVATPKPPPAVCIKPEPASTPVKPVNSTPVPVTPASTISLMPGTKRSIPLAVPQELLLDANAKPKPTHIDPFAELMRTPAPASLLPLRMVEPLSFEPVDVAQELMELAVELGYLIARADGRLAQAEQQMIEGYLDSRYHTDVAMHTKAMSLSAHFTKATIAIQPLVERIRKHCHSEAILHLMNLAKEVAFAGNLNDKKHQCYLDIGKRLGLALTPLNAVSPKTVQAEPKRAEIKPPQPAKPAPSLEVQQRQALEIDVDIPLSTDLVRRQFNKLSDRLQANKIAHLGADFAKLAEERFAAAKGAAEALLQAMGEQLMLPTKSAEPVGLRDNKELDELFGE